MEQVNSTRLIKRNGSFNANLVRDLKLIAEDSPVAVFSIIGVQSSDAKIEHATWNHETVQRKKFEREINACRDKLRKMTETFEREINACRDKLRKMTETLTETFEREINACRDKLRKMTETFEFDLLKVKNQTSKTNWWSKLAQFAAYSICGAIPLVVSFFFPALPLLWLLIVNLACVLVPCIVTYLLL